MNTFVKVMHASTCNCAACASVPTLGIEMPYNIKENCLAVACPKVAAMLSEKDKHLAFDVTTGSGRKLTFVCPDCKQKFEAAICNVVRSVGNGTTGCPVCAGRKVVPGINDLASQYPEVATMWSSKNKLPASEVATQSGKKAFFKCHNCGQEFKTKIADVVNSVKKGRTGCPVCAGKTVVPGIRYTMIRIQEPGLEVLDPKYDIVMPEGFRDSGGRYNAEIMEEVGRKVIHLLEEIYGRKASPEIWALNNFKEFEDWYDANKKELEANAKKRGPKGKTAVKKAA